MSMNITGDFVHDFLYGSNGAKENKSENSKVLDHDSVNDGNQKTERADRFLAEHDRLYAEQMAAVTENIVEGMAVAQEIARRMSGGAKVSQSDENNLMQYDMRMYMAAKNAQIMAQRKKDMSDESLIDEFVKKHADDRKDWTTELNDKLIKANLGSGADSDVSERGIDISL